MTRESFLACCVLVCTVSLSDVRAAGDEFLPVPDATSLREAEKRLQESLSIGLAGHPRKEQAALLLERIRATKNSAMRYVGFRLALELAIKSGDARTMFEAVEGIAGRHRIDQVLAEDKRIATYARKKKTVLEAVIDAYLSLIWDIEGFEERLKILDQSVKLARNAEATTRIVYAYVGLARKAVEVDNYPVALKAAGKGQKLASKAKLKTLRSKGVLREITDLQREYTDLGIREAVRRIFSHPEDRETHLTLGRFLCMAKGNWEKGLPHLAKSSSSSLSSLAQKDLTRPTSPGARLAIGDGWWDQVRDQRGIYKRQVLSRAAHWYRKAVPGLQSLTSVKEEARAQRRLAEFRKMARGWQGLILDTGPMGYVLTAVSGADGRFDEVRMGRRTVYRARMRKKTTGQYAPYMYFQAPDDLPLRKGTLYLQLTYRDVGSGALGIDYNAEKHDYADAPNRLSLTNTWRYRTGLFVLSGADLRRAQVLDADLRINITSEVRLHVVEARLFLDPPF